jgi:hypothetical protein
LSAGQRTTSITKVPTKRAAFEFGYARMAPIITQVRQPQTVV